MTAILQQDNEIYILDEPFNGVDIHSNLIIVEIIKKLKSIGKTILISSHIFSTLADSCDELILLKEGQIINRAKSHEFAQLERQMKAFTIDNRIDQLDLK